jgi:hypothetical protein
MVEQMAFNYYYGNQADQFSFVRIPKMMLKDKRFADLSLAAKMLYGLLLDRMNLSMKNGWLDDENRVYIIYQIAEIQEDLGYSKKKSIEFLGELETFGLIEKKRRGLGLSNIVYVKSFLSGTSRGVENDTSGNPDTDASEDDSDGGASDSASEEPKIRVSERKKPLDSPVKWNKSSRSVDVYTSRGVETTLPEVSKSTLQEVSITTPQEVPIPAPLKSNNNINNTYRIENESNLILSPAREPALVEKSMRCDIDEMAAYSEIIKENIEFDSLLQRYPYEQEMIQGIFDLILETVLTQGEKILISSNTYPTQLVKSKFLKLNYSHIEYVMSCMSKNTTKVQNIKKYLLAALFNAPSTIDGYFKADVNHDFPQYAVN